MQDYGTFKQYLSKRSSTIPRLMSQDEEHKNTDAISSFLTTHKLRNRLGGPPQFNATVVFQTREISEETTEAQVMITTEGYNNPGRIVLLNENLHPSLYPTDFDARFQTFEDVNNEYLLITGTHASKPMIGKYEIKIFPLDSLNG